MRSTLGAVLGRRFIILVAVLMGLTAVAASLAPRQPVPRDQRAAEPTPTPTPAVDGAGRTVERKIETTGAPSRVVVDQGQLLELTVNGTELDSVSLRGEIEPVTPEAAAVFNVYADVPGDYEIVLEGEQRVIGTLIVRG
jgi:hypothetical protein